MKYIKYIVAMAVAVLSLSSCLESNLEDLDTFEGNDIQSGYAFYRYIDSTTTIPASGEYAVKQKQLQQTAQSIDTLNATCSFSFSIPSNFTDTEKAGVSIDKLVVMVSVSSGAIVTPVDDSPKLGVPADWSEPHKYKITSASGEEKVWTISVTLVE